MRVKGIGASKHKLGEFAFTALHMPGLDRGGLEVYTCIQCELHLVEGLKANMFIGNDVLYIESFTINLASASTHILICSVTIIINARNRSQFLKRNVLANVTTFIPPKSEALVNF